MTEFSLGEPIMQARPYAFPPIEILDEQVENLVLVSDEKLIKIEMLVYSNQEIMDSYLDDNLWSSNYFEQKKAERFQMYSDGYACQLRIRTDSKILDQDGDGFGIIFSQFGY